MQEGTEVTAGARRRGAALSGAFNVENIFKDMETKALKNVKQHVKVENT